jgi:hypothetical protein
MTSPTDWISAWGQVGGAIGTVATFVAVIWIDRRDKNDRAAAQARLLTVEPDYHHRAEGDVDFVACVVNHSKEPFFNVAIVDVCNTQHPEVKWRPADTARRPYEAQILEPGEGGSIYLPIVLPDDVDRLTRYGEKRDQITVRYTDSNGLNWKRRDQEAPDRLRERMWWRRWR